MHYFRKWKVFRLELKTKNEENINAANPDITVSCLTLYYI